MAVILSAVLLFSFAATFFVACKETHSDTKSTVTFYYNYRDADGEPVTKDVEIENDSTVTAPDDPVRDGYIFDGWCADKRGKHDFDFTVPITRDTVIYARWADALATVTFDCGYEGSELVVLDIDVGSTVPEDRIPADPTRDRFEFLGWFTDRAATSPFDPAAPIKRDTTIFAGWKQLEVAVTFDIGYDGQGPATQVFAVGGTATEPPEPVRGEAGDYRFEGWYTGSGRNETLFDFGAALSADVALHAKWTALRATVVYNENYDGGASHTQKTDVGELIGSYGSTRVGYTLAGWYYDAACTIPFDFEKTPVGEDIELYAKWEPIALTITYHYNYSGAPADLVVETTYDAVITEPQDPTRTNYTFMYWCTDAAGNNEFLFDKDKVLKEDLDLYANWRFGTWTTVYNITYHMNDGTDDIYRYNGRDSEPVTIYRKSSMRNNPSYPPRAGYLAVGWYTDPECTEEFNFSTPIRQNYDLYAKWLKEAVFEAELTQLTDIGPKHEAKPGRGESSNPSGTNLIEYDQYNVGASGTFYVSYLHYYGAYLEFCIDASRAVDDATLVLRLTPDLYNIYFKSGIASADDDYVAPGTTTGDKDGYKVLVNPVYDYNDVTGVYTLVGQDQKIDVEHDLTGAIEPDNGGYTTKRPFEDYNVTASLKLRQGRNTIRLVTDNNRAFYGTMAAAAPMVDCIKIYTSEDVTLGWAAGERYDVNIEGIMEERWPQFLQEVR